MIQLSHEPETARAILHRVKSVKDMEFIFMIWDSQLINRITGHE